jgi:uncharacterized membrane protein YesL
MATWLQWDVWGSAYDAVQCILTARSWAAVQVMLQVFTFAFLVVIGCVIIMTPVMLYVFRLVVRRVSCALPANQLATLASRSHIDNRMRFYDPLT